MRLSFGIGMAALGVVAGAGLVLARGPMGPGGETLEYEVIEVQPRGWMVTAREVGSGAVVQFRMPPAVFRSQRFRANLEGVRAGQRFSASGPPQAGLDEVVLEVAPGHGGGSPVGPRGGPPGTQGPPSSPGPSAPGLQPAGRPGFPGSAQGSPGFERDYQILSADPNSGEVVAREEGTGRQIHFRIDVGAFVGYRFEADLTGLRRGQGFTLVAPNDRPIQDCCTLIR
jgi:hypothetical protein